MKARLLTVAILLSGAVHAIAAEEAQKGHAEHGIPWGILFFTAVNFSLFVLLIVRMALPALRTWAIDRRDRIVDQLQKASAAREEAERLKSEWEERLKGLESVSFSPTVRQRARSSATTFAVRATMGVPRPRSRRARVSS